MSATPHAPESDDPRPVPEEVHLEATSLDRFEPLIGRKRMNEVRRAIRETKSALAGRVVWQINSTSTGGGVAEMLHGLLPYLRGAQIDTRWLVLGGEEHFFRITKRLHHALHGSQGDGSPLGEDERRAYEAVLEHNAAHITALVQEGDIVLLHDPQTAGLIPRLKRDGAHVIWRSHIGIESETPETRAGWAFLQRYLGDAEALVFSRRQYVPAACRGARIAIIPPAIDPFSVKNADLPRDTAHAILTHTGIIEGPPEEPPVFTREDGSPGRVDRQADVVRLGRAPGWDTPLVVQVSRWDPLKDHEGVMRGFALLLEGAVTDAHLVLAGPNVHGVADDPEQAQVLDELIAAWRKLPHSARSRIHLACLPTADFAENAAIVNALQRHATVVVQKSLAEGFGLTVTEAMWKARPVVASAVGGIVDQIENGVSGLLLPDPHDLPGLAALLREVLSDPERARSLGDAARKRVIDHFLATRQLMQHGELVRQLLGKRRTRKAAS